MKKQLLLVITVVLLQVANCLLPTISYAQKIAGGGRHSLAVCSDSSVMVWGWNNYGELGNGSPSDSPIPIQVTGLAGIYACAGGYANSLALKSNGTVWTWGNNTSGELGNGTINNSNFPMQATGLSGIVAIAGVSASPLILGYSLQSTRIYHSRSPYLPILEYALLSIKQ